MCLNPPGVPYIEGYAPGEVIRRGQHVQLACRSRGGNPPAQLIWYKNGNQARMAYRTTDRFSENIYVFVAEASDNKARLRCEANNKMATKILKAEVTLNVLLPPGPPIISGYTEGSIITVGTRQKIMCTSSGGNPLATLVWYKNDKKFFYSHSNYSYGNNQSHTSQE
uniref:Ig-like domain-containing protein n=1 Tax=Anopheles melas TaxID=34690 RepID=A0A182UKQ9_9DIPT